MTKEEFDAAVKALRGKVAPRFARSKALSTPEEWAASLDYCEQQRKANPDRCRESGRKWRSANTEKVRAKNSRNYYADQAMHCERARNWRQSNPEKARQKDRIVQSRARKTNPDFKVRSYLRSRLLSTVKGNAKKGSAVRDLGCTIAEFWAHMEPQFQPGMTRENMGKAWEVDHIFPLAKIKRGCRIEFLSAANWRNLQPLTPKQNRDKGDKVTPESQALFDQLKAEFAREIYAESA
jgi:hypothetical protein